MRFSWVLQDRLALGTAPQGNEDLDRLDAEGIRAVLTLCAEEEAPLPEELGERFAWKRRPLPDHTYGRAPGAIELREAIAAMAALQRHGPVFVHCRAAVERSPLVVIGWLIRERGLSRLQALDYLMQVHPGASPLPGQLAALEAILVPEPFSTVNVA